MAARTERARTLLDGLNPEQREAVITTEGPLLVLAGAGSGKTRVICHRLAYILAAGFCGPRNVIAVTFTNKAAGEMKERVSRLTGLDVRSLWVSTFHSAAVRMLRAAGNLVGVKRDFTIYDEGDSEALVKRIIKDRGWDPREEKPRHYAELISRAKDDALDPDDWLEKTFLHRAVAEKIYEVYREYEKRLARAGALDFGSLLLRAVKLLRHPEGKRRFGERFQYVMVDEYQDTNAVQYEMVRLLAAAHGNVCVVGDDDQAIYEWRGANRANILAFEKTFPKAKVITLTRNYRSTQGILDAASHLIGNNTRLREKKLRAERGSGSVPRLIRARNEYDEAEQVVRAIRTNLKAGAAKKDHAVFYRVHALSRVLEEVLSASGIEYQLLRGVSFYQRAEIKDVVAYLKLLVNPDDDGSFLRICNKPARGFGAKTLERLVAAATERNLSLMAYLRKCGEDRENRPAQRKKEAAFVEMLDELQSLLKKESVSIVVREVLERTRYLELYDQNDPEDLQRFENVREFLSAAQDFEESADEPTLAAFLERITLATDADDYDPSADRVVLSTLHAAKGLEFRHVFIVGCEEGLLPHGRALGEEADAEMEEERRLAYVGMTRAKDTLTMSYAFERRMYGQIQARTRSRFLSEAGIDDTSDWGGTERETRSFFVGRTPATLSGSRDTGIVGCGVLSEGDSVRHHRFGTGVVLYVAESGDENEVVQIRFKNKVKNLMTKFAHLTRV